MNFDFLYSLELVPIILGTINVTITISLVTFIVSLIISNIFIVLKFYKVIFLDKLIELYISFFRGSPLVVQIFLIYYGIPQVVDIDFFKNMTAYEASVIALSLHFSAYITEVFRGSIIAIPKGLLDASKALALSNTTTFIYIVFPQMIRLSIQSIMNIFADIVKSTSLVFMLGVIDIMATAKIEASNSYKYFESYIVVALVYWAIITLFSILEKLLEKRLNRGYNE